MHNSHFGNQANDRQKFKLAPEELSHLLNYPAVGELFSDDGNKKLVDFQNRLAEIVQNMERTVRYGSRTESERAEIIVRALKTTIDFLNSLAESR